MRYNAFSISCSLSRMKDYVYDFQFVLGMLAEKLGLYRFCFGRIFVSKDYDHHLSFCTW